MTAEVAAPTTTTMEEGDHQVISEIPSVSKPTVHVNDIDTTETTVDASSSSLLGDEVVVPIQPTSTTTSNQRIPTTISTIIPKLDYCSIPSFDKFTQLTEDDHYLCLPRDWHVLVADIEGSTRLIEQGRYRDVNTIGVACIAAVRNALNTTKKFNEDFPYVFGGDGATLCVAPHQFEAACNALRGVQTLAAANYDMHLRIGSMEVATLEDEGKVVVEVARYEIADGMCIALFRGGGLALADTWIKAGQGQIEQLPYLEEEDESEEGDEDDNSDGDEDASLSDDEEEESTKKGNPTEANLDGLSCRWKKIPSKHGCVLSLLVMHNEDVYSNDFLSRREMMERASEDDDDTTQPDPDQKPSSSEIYSKVLLKLGEILAPQNSLSKANPVNPELGTYKSADEMIEDEHRMHTNGKRSFAFWTSRAVEIGLCHVIFKMKQLQTAIIDAPAYTQAMRTHADHCKFDDMIRMVLDCTPAQADAIESYLQGLHREGRQVFYGTQRSKHTLMTCLLEDTNKGNHIHFVDGDLGGYALAAKDLKLQLGNYALAKRGMTVRLNLQKQHSQRKKSKGKKKLRKTITK